METCSTRCFLKTVEQTKTSEDDDKRLISRRYYRSFRFEGYDSCTPIIRIVIAFSAHSSRERKSAACAAVFHSPKCFVCNHLHPESGTISRIKSDLDSNTPRIDLTSDQIFRIFIPLSIEITYTESFQFDSYTSGI